jgi:hypothetical protein
MGHAREAGIPSILPAGVSQTAPTGVDMVTSDLRFRTEICGGTILFETP